MNPRTDFIPERRACPFYPCPGGRRPGDLGCPRHNKLAGIARVPRSDRPKTFRGHSVPRKAHARGAFKKRLGGNLKGVSPEARAAWTTRSGAEHKVPVLG